MLQAEIIAQNATNQWLRRGEIEQHLPLRYVNLFVPRPDQAVILQRLAMMLKKSPSWLLSIVCVCLAAYGAENPTLVKEQSKIEFLGSP